MTNPIKQKALALVNEAAKGVIYYELDDLDDLERVYFTEALCRAIEQHEAFRQEVSDAVGEYFGAKDLDVILAGHSLASFIIPKPVDPLVEAVEDWINNREFGEDAASLRAAIEKRGGKITWGEG